MPTLKAEVIAIGNEVLAGHAINGNAAFISQKLNGIGFNVVRHTAIPDDHEIIVETLSESLACVPLVIATGGLGPTIDDLTRGAAAELFDSPLEFSPTLAAELKNRFGDIPSLHDQATVPTKALILPNLIGTASGLIFYNGRSTLVLLPGVPFEMRSLMENSVLPYLEKTFTLSPPKTETLHFVNIFESRIDERLRELNEKYPDARVGIYPANGLVSVSLDGDSKTVVKFRDALLQEFEFQRYIAADWKIETAVHALFIEKKLTLACAESCSGGALSGRLTAIPGASAFFLGTVVAYANRFKEEFLQIAHPLIEEKGAVSAEVAAALAESVQKKSNASFGLAITGIAGPDGGTVEKPVGTVFIAIKPQDKPAKVFPLHAHGSRAMIIDGSVNWALGYLYQWVKYGASGF